MHVRKVFNAISLLEKEEDNIFLSSFDFLQEKIILNSVFFKISLVSLFLNAAPIVVLTATIGGGRD